MKILLTAIGKRVQLIKHLKEKHKVIGVDCGSQAAAIDFVDNFYQVPRYDELGYIDTLLHICEVEKVNMLIPLYEREFSLLYRNLKAFEVSGTTILLSSEHIIETFDDKYKTFLFFKSNGINTPVTYIKADIELKIKEKYELFKFPLIIKPAKGMGSKDVFKINNYKELEFFKDYVENPVFQQFICGKEYTIDALFDLQSNVISIVPRGRIEVKSGEVSKSRTVKDEKIINAAYALCKKLKGAKGPITIQCIVDQSGDIYFIEINPRFGGGVPLTFEAGVNYGKYLEMMYNQERIEPIIGQFEEVMMLRYDEAVFRRQND